MRTADHVLSMRIKEGAAGYGVYMMLLELLRDAEQRSVVCNPAHLAFAINEPDVNLVERVIRDYALFELDDDNKMSSPWLNDQLSEWDAKRQAAVEAGKRGAAKRYGKIPATESVTSDPMGGAMGSLEGAHSNIPIYIQTKTDKPTNQDSKSKLKDLHWDKWTECSLFDLAREDSEPMGAAEEAELQQNLDWNREHGQHALDFQFLYDFSLRWHFNGRQYRFLRLLCHQGERTSRPMLALYEIDKKALSGEFRPKYMLEYVISRILPLRSPAAAKILQK